MQIRRVTVTNCIFVIEVQQSFAVCLCLGPGDPVSTDTVYSETGRRISLSLLLPGSLFIARARGSLKLTCSGYSVRK